MEYQRLSALVPLLAVTCHSIALAQCVTPPADLVGWWTGDNNFTDISGNNLDGVEHGSVPFVAGEVDNAFSFDGDSANFVAIDNNPVLEPQVISVDMWVKGSSQTLFNYILSKGAEEDITPSYGMYTGNSGGIFFLVSDGSSFLLSPDGGTAIWDNTWHHVAGTYDGQFISIYIDGVLIGSNPGSILINYNLSTHDKLLIGTYSDIPVLNGFTFTGSIDEVEVFDRALTPPEINSIYAAGPDGKCNTNILVWSYSNDFCFTHNEDQFLPTVIYGSSAVDASNIDISTLSLDGVVNVVQINSQYIYSLLDVNIDSYLDLVVLFDKAAGALAVGNPTPVLLKGNLADGTQIRSNGEFCLEDAS